VQLDNTRLAIRERDLTDVLDLSLQVIRTHFVPWLVASTAGALPLAVLNWWILRPAWQRYGEVGWPTSFGYVALMGLLIAWELPLASAFVTRYLGDSMFDRPPARKVIRDVIDSLPQMFWFDGVLRGIFFLPALAIVDIWWVMGFAAWIPFVYAPYLNEVILLERNPMFRKKGRVTTWKRSQALHDGSRSTLFSRWLSSVLIAALLISSLASSMWEVRGVLLNQWAYDESLWLIYVPASMWIVASFFAVVRYLSYLDLRIRREGWEVELLIRAEADRLTRQVG
jgi:hypothetical protein